MTLIEIQEHFASAENILTSKIVSVLSKFISTQPKMLAIASLVPIQHSPRTVFLAAVHAILLSGEKHALQDFYPSVAGPLELTPEREKEFCSIFLDFYNKFEDKIIPYMKNNTQTNEVRRSFVLLPAISEILSRDNINNISLIEIGTSAGLLLNIDKYKFNINNTIFGNEASKLTLTTQWNGDLPENLLEKFPEINCKIGIDLNPLNLNDPEVYLWLKALIWPEHGERFTNFELAADIFKNNNSEILLKKGTFEEYLDLIVDKCAHSDAILIFSVWVLYQFSDDDLTTLYTNLKMLSLKLNKKIYFLHDDWTLEQNSNNPSILLKEILPNGIINEKTLCQVDHHGKYLEIYK